MAIGMAIGILVFPSGSALSQGKGGGAGKLKNEKQWLRSKLKALASLLGKLEVKVTEAWHHWGTHQLDPQQDERGSGLGIAKPMGIGRSCQRIALYVLGHEKVMSFLSWK